MSENAKIQLSIKGQAPMLNIYADDHEDYLELLNGFLDEPQTDVVLAQTQVAVNVSAAFAAPTAWLPRPPRRRRTVWCGAYGCREARGAPGYRSLGRRRACRATGGI